ncbi:hypothetical protein D3C71_2147790 [compost metagenome]
MACDRATPANAIDRPHSAAVSSNNTVKVLASLLARKVSNQPRLPLVARKAFIATHQEMPSNTMEIPSTA